jgi:hypothetical protein
MGRTVDSTLWPMLCAKSQLLDRIPKGSTETKKFEWETANTRGKTFTSAAHGAETGIDSSNSGTKIGAGSGIGVTLQKGSIIRNASVATPVGTYGVDEIMMVTANDGTDITVKRNYAQPVGSTTNQGSTLHSTTAVYEVLFSPKEEGSSPDENKYQDVSLVYNECSILDFYLTVTGSQLAEKRLVPADNLQRQFEDRLIELKNEMESMFLYGALNPGSAATGADTEANAHTGSDSYVRTTKGFQNFVSTATAVTAGNVDYTTKAVTEEAINQITASMMSSGVDMSDTFIIAAHPNHIRTISAFGADKVRITQAETKWGRSLKSFETDLGVEMELVPCLNVSKSDLFIINIKRCALMTFRPFQKFEWGIDTSSPDGTDAWKQRYLGEIGVKIVDGSKAHGALSYITW